MAADSKLKKDYLNQIKGFQPRTPYISNCIKAFLVGGLICTIGQVIQNFFIHFFNFTKDTAASPTIATLVLISALLTGFGVYDKIGQFAGAGSAIPVTGFANSMTSAALEHRSEGIVLGIATNMFKLAGSVIVFGVVAAYVIGVVRYCIKLFFF
ncbi:stage V sporulation protein AC [Bacillus mesophilus]|uniref:Stage V sporulation protein AC n=1 Tax=Bacillus mesophilus TaxID=1808955 RepID=A0A6M0Q4L6_9BACI|nr:stage V sporulation protein AC [Bacillus mesophilus]MBM7661147.1 stage V sporulation protein AC [Bacillus mesophilus]NEY71325.1 stage V sporulation protein AC [Bacillus mesophilus]